MDSMVGHRRAIHMSKSRYIAVRELANNRKKVRSGLQSSLRAWPQVSAGTADRSAMRAAREQLPPERTWPDRRGRGRTVALDAGGLSAADAAPAGARRERARMRAWLHDTVLQPLEFIAAGGYADEPDPVALSAIAASAADQLRAEIEGELPPAAGPLIEEIHSLVERERLTAPHRIDLDVGVIEPAFSQAGAEPLIAAVSEALRNAGKHAGART